jgi:hypothetical protein
MYNDDFENEDFFEENEENEQDELTQIMQTNEVKGMYHDIVDQLVRANFKNIEANGIDVDQMKLINLNQDELKNTLTFMLNWFAELEEYEKCGLLKKYLVELEKGS